MNIAKSILEKRAGIGAFPGALAGGGLGYGAMLALHLLSDSDGFYPAIPAAGAAIGGLLGSNVWNKENRPKNKARVELDALRAKKEPLSDLEKRNLAVLEDFELGKEI